MISPRDEKSLRDRNDKGEESSNNFGIPDLPGHWGLIFAVCLSSEYCMASRPSSLGRCVRTVVEKGYSM